MDKIVEIENLGKAYVQGHEQVQVLEEINFFARKGEFIVLLGPSGSGKSTFLNLVGLLDDSYSGEIRLYGRKLELLGEKEKASLRLKNIGFIFQFDSLLPEFTVLENIDMPSRIAGRSDPARARGLLKRFGLEALADKFPMEISGGEKQRAAILRALANNPGLLIADEPTGNLDKHNAGIVLDDLKKANSLGAAVLMVTHNEEFVSYADRVFHLSGGRLESGQKT
ncbi:MAG: lipoprotein ABC transporter ATP-binding protein [Elusimicrobia bacterium GWF2_52_66]|nr:MAG: lipoprotein ABC transporter ATP-binding protein [Elusimicrobia bacterium GWA2_51_34]OGR85625.1 MAG: lipoprotein ABC transporter ATP-binding protein [Elusimicrobia bacterium GWF2_52_66]HAF95869.1 lipoprotein-releasing system ATP-binding protein LolD [Elusimicrobiota bacterium]HCE97980.1 lipoprotein-releasing system ATP-binding protein LolD [Elusimicrobiota bacterium]